MISLSGSEGGMLSTYMHEVETLTIEVWYLFSKILASPTWERRFVVRQLAYTGPGAFIGRTKYPARLSHGSHHS